MGWVLGGTIRPVPQDTLGDKGRVHLRKKRSMIDKHIQSSGFIRGGITASPSVVPQITKSWSFAWGRKTCWGSPKSSKATLPDQGMEESARYKHG